jgi:hypothetical protein
LKRATLLPALLAAGALALVAAGCGGDDEGGGDGERLTKAQFVVQGNAICKAGNAKAEALKPDLPPTFDPTKDSTPEEQLDKFGDYLDDLVDIFKDQNDKLHDLNPPEELEDDFNKALSISDETINEAEEAAEAAHDADREKLKDKLAEGQKHSDEADALATKIGLTECAS